MLRINNYEKSRSKTTSNIFYAKKKQKKQISQTVKDTKSTFGNNIARYESRA